MSTQTGDGAVLQALALRDIRRNRLVAGFAVAVLVPAVVQWLCVTAWGSDLTAASLLQLTGAVGASLLGGIVPGLLAALWATLLLNYFMVQPTGSLFIHDATTVVSLVCFVVVSAAVAAVVHLSERRLAQARRARAEAAVLNRLALVVVAARDPVSRLLLQAQEVLGADGVGLFVRPAGEGLNGDWERRAGVGYAPESPARAEVVEPVDESTVLALRGPALSSEQRGLLRAFTAQLVAVRDRQRLAVSLDENRALAQDNRMRTSILQAVSHDLRTPLAGIKLTVSSLLQPHARFDSGQRRELLDTIEAYTDQLSTMVENLLDLSRIAGGAVTAVQGPVQWRDVLPGTLRTVPTGSVDVHGMEWGTPVVADAGLVERVVANLVENAIRHAPGSRITVAAQDMVEDDGSRYGELRVIDSGSAPSVTLPDDLEELFVPFQRFGDAGGAGTGLGLAVARGLTEAMGGTLHAERTPGGGLTMVLRLLQAERAPGPDRADGMDEETGR
ncbi:MAG: histidine kinase [Citricoccus sp.]|nr:histidine kinase [Citricoccus sp. WCRC_4]